MHAVCRRPRTIPPSPCPKRHSSSTNNLLQQAIAEIHHHKLKITLNNNFFLIKAPYGIACGDGIKGSGAALASIHFKTGLIATRHIANRQFNNLSYYLRKSREAPVLADYLKPIEEAVSGWQLNEIRTLDPGHFSKMKVKPKAAIEYRALKYYEMCMRIAVSLARSQAAMGNSAITLDKLYEGPIHPGTIVNNDGILVSESLSEIVTPIGTMLTGNPSFLPINLNHVLIQLQVEDGSIRVDLDGIRRPKCIKIPSGVSRQEAIEYWQKVRDIILYQACENLRDKTSRMCT